MQGENVTFLFQNYDLCSSVKSCKIICFGMNEIISANVNTNVILISFIKLLKYRICCVKAHTRDLKLYQTERTQCFMAHGSFYMQVIVAN